MRYIGLDISLRNTGMAIIEKGKAPQLYSFGGEANEKITIERQMYQLKRVDILGFAKGAFSVCIESAQAPFGRGFSGGFIERTELIGMVHYLACAEYDVYPVKCAPMTLKKFFGVGKKVSKKKTEVVEVVQSWWPKAKIADADQADALGLATILQVLVEWSKAPVFPRLLPKQLEAVETFRQANGYAA